MSGTTSTTGTNPEAVVDAVFVAQHHHPATTAPAGFYGELRRLMVAAITADRAQRPALDGAEIYVIQSEMGDVIDVTDSLEWAQWLTREDDDNPLRTMVKETVWSGPEDRSEW